MAGFTGSAKFQHIAQHGNAAAAGAGLAVMQNLQGCFHAVRAGVIAILNKGHTAVLHNVLAHTGGLIAGQRTGGAGTLQPQAGGCSISSKGIIHGMNACRGDGYTELIRFAVHVIHQGKAGTLPYGMNIDGAHIGGAGADAEPHRAQAAGDLRGGQQVIVRIQNQRGAVRQALADFHLCLQYILPRAQIFQVGNADHRNDTGRRPRCAHQAGNLAQVAHAHFHHSILGGILQAEQRVGQADLIVLVALCF